MKVIAQASVSLDGYVNDAQDGGYDVLFDWCVNGDVEIPTADPKMTMHPTEASAAQFRAMLELGVLVVGRKLYDQTNGWNGRHPLGVRVVVLTHDPLPDDEWFTFVSDGIEAAIAKARELAGGKDVGLAGGTIASQALEAGLLDEIWFDLVPVVFGAGTPFFANVASRALEGPISVVEGRRVTHLRYSVQR
jgi:dihydrofolate reductase